MTQVDIDTYCPVDCVLDDAYEDWVFDCKLNSKHRQKKVRVQAKNGGAECNNPVETAMMDKNDKCGSSFPLIMILVVLAILGVIAFYFSSRHTVSLK